MNRAVSKTAIAERLSKVRILPPPRMFNFFKKEKKEPKNFREVLIYLKRLEERLESVSRKIDNLKKEGKFSIQKVAMIRFNPFSEAGGDQSFSIALLNANDDGIVITGLFARNGNRVYAKPVKAGISDYSLSDEEKEAINKAKKSKT